LLKTLERRWFDDFNIRDYRIVPTPKGMLEEESRFVQVIEVAYNEDLSQSLHPYNMQNVLSSLRDGSHSLAYAICSNGRQVKLHIGVRRCKSDDLRSPTHEYVKMLGRALRSNYPGIVLGKMPVPPDKTDILNKVLHSDHLASITGIPSLRNPNNPEELFGQSIERLVDALRDEEYMFLILAEPFFESRLTEIIAQLRLISGEVHSLVRQSKSISRTEGESTSVTEGTTQQATLGVGQLVSAIFGISFGISTSHQEAIGYSESLGASVTQESLDKTAEFCEKALEHYIDRVQRGRSLGFWNTGIFIATNNLNTFLRSQGIARSLFSGQNTYFEPIRVHDLADDREVRKSLANLRIPVLAHLLGDRTPKPIDHPLGLEYQSLGTPVTTDELSILISFPNREVPGLKMKRVTDFNLNPPLISGAEIGTLLYRGDLLDTRIAVSQKSLTRHTFITGLTGSGKTNTCLALLEDSYRKQGLNFLVIDPAKTEYRFLMNSETLGKDLLVFTLGDEKLSPFRLNPFEFVRGFPLLGHIDLIKAVFNAAFPMYASMPYLLEEAILEIYQERGWDISSTRNQFLPDFEYDETVDYTPYLPRLSDLYAKIDTVVVRKHYETKIAQDLTAALKARLGSLLHGGKGLMLDTLRSISIKSLLDRPVVLELRRAGDDDERAFIMALIFVLLFEVCQNRSIEDQLRHITLIEEAHRLLRNIPMSVSMESANPRGKAVEMFTDMMAEMRAHGEGFIIVDQIPNKLVPDVIKGSNLKIIHRLMAQDDRLVVGNAMGMTQEQIDYLPRQKKGEAIIHSEELEEACSVLIDSVEDRLAVGKPGSSPTKREENTVRQLQQRSREFFKLSPALLYKHSACVLCDAPCTYHPDENAPTEHLVRLAQYYLSVVALGSWNGCLRAGERLHVELTHNQRARFPKGCKPGKERCMRVLLAAQAVRNFAEAYSLVGNWKAVIGLQLQLAKVWEFWPNEKESLNKLRSQILKEIATSPAEPRLGCTYCPRRCWFGFAFQNTNRPLVIGLSSQLRTQKANQRVNPDKLARVVGDTFGENMAVDFLPYAAYCLFTQCTKDERALRRFRHMIQEKKG
jgi:DNA helicase HerA-like ATPase